MTEQTTTRRGLIKSMAAIIAAPAIVRISSIMPIKGDIYTATNPWWNYPLTLHGVPLQVDGGYWGVDDEVLIRLLQHRIEDAERVFHENLQRQWADMWRQPNTEHAQSILDLLEQNHERAATDLPRLSVRTGADR